MLLTKVHTFTHVQVCKSMGYNDAAAFAKDDKPLPIK